MQIEKLLELVVLEVSQDGNLGCRASILISNVIGMQLKLFEGLIGHTDV